MTLRRRALWALLAAKLAGGWGVGWDIRWHVLIGRDSFWIAPHVLTYAAVTASVVVALGVLLAETWRARRGAPLPSAIRIAGLTGTPGFHVAWWGAVLIVLAAPIDDLWHRLFGIDVTLWSPPHLLGFAGSQVATLGGLLIALEVYPPGRWRWAALATGGTLMLGTFYFVVDPSIQTAFRRAGVFFFTHAVLGSLIFGFTLVLVARLAGRRSAPVVLTVGALAVQLTIFAAGDLGFALTRPTPAVREAIAADPGSPIAIAHEMARRGGTTPGRSLTLRLIPLLPAALMALADPLRRWPLAALVFGLGMLAASGGVLGRSPALAHALPALPHVLVALVLAPLAALAGGWVGARLAARLALEEAAVRSGWDEARPGRARGAATA
jgi:hypothetical protein